MWILKEVSASVQKGNCCVTFIPCGEIIVDVIFIPHIQRALVSQVGKITRLKIGISLIFPLHRVSSLPAIHSWQQKPSNRGRINVDSATRNLRRCWLVLVLTACFDSRLSVDWEGGHVTAPYCLASLCTVSLHEVGLGSGSCYWANLNMCDFHCWRLHH